MDVNFCITVAKYIRRHAKTLIEQLDGIVEGEDAEFVHRARVASRRLRAALQMAKQCLGRKRVRRWRRAIRDLGQELGGARDKDVQVEFLCDAVHHVTRPECYPGVVRLLVDCELRRQRFQPRVLAAIKRFKRSGAGPELQKAAKRLLVKLDAEEAGNGPCACVVAERSIVERLEEMLSYQDCLADAHDHERHHAMRIAAKRLRYTLEIANPLYDKNFETTIDVVKRLQTLLGDIHDCDVWQEELNHFADRQREDIRECYGTDQPMARLQPGIDLLRRDRHDRRHYLFLELVGFWADVTRQHTWETLFGLLRAGSNKVLPQAARAPAVVANGDGAGNTKRVAVHPLEESPARPGESPNEPQRRQTHPGQVAAR